MLRADQFKFPVLASAALTPGMVIAVAPAALVSVVDADVKFDVGFHSTLHMEDTSPAQIGVAGSPNVVAAPVLSAFQSDLVAFRFILPACWGLRGSNAVAWTQAITW